VSNTSKELSEQEKIQLTEVVLNELSDKAFAKVLKAKTLDEVMGGVFEETFVEVAFRQGNRRIEKWIRYAEGTDTPEAKAYDVAWIAEVMDLINQINRGDWKNAKEFWLKFHTLRGPMSQFGFVSIPTRRWFEEHGLDPDMTFLGQTFVPKDNEVRGTEIYYKKHAVWERFLEHRYDLIPDKTEPYAYPHLDELKAKIS